MSCLIYIGWGDHIICNKKYHFLVPSKDTLAACLSYEGNENINIGAGTDGVKGKLNLIMELQGHILHGVFHSNGFGHLLCINDGLEIAYAQLFKQGNTCLTLLASHFLLLPF